jgi:hypothetical protein
MKKVRDLIRLKYETRLSHEQIARALSISKGVVAKYVGRIEARGLDPAVLLTRDEGELTRRLGWWGRGRRRGRCDREGVQRSSGDVWVRKPRGRAAASPCSRLDQTTGGASGADGVGEVGDEGGRRECGRDAPPAGSRRPGGALTAVPGMQADGVAARV